MEYCKRLGSIQLLYSVCFVLSGSLWDPHMTVSVSVDKEHKTSVVVGFEAANYSEKYQVSIQVQGFWDSKNVSKVITMYHIYHLY